MQTAGTPLHQAAVCGHEAAIKALVAAKADVDAKDRVRAGMMRVPVGRRRRVCI